MLFYSGEYSANQKYIKQKMYLYSDVFVYNIFKFLSFAKAFKLHRTDSWKN